VTPATEHNIADPHCTLLRNIVGDQRSETSFRAGTSSADCRADDHIGRQVSRAFPLGGAWPPDSFIVFDPSRNGVYGLARRGSIPERRRCSVGRIARIAVSMRRRNANPWAPKVMSPFATIVDGSHGRYRRRDRAPTGTVSADHIPNSGNDLLDWVEQGGLVTLRARRCTWRSPCFQRRRWSPTPGPTKSRSRTRRSPTWQFDHHARQHLDNKIDTTTKINVQEIADTFVAWE